MQWLLDRYASLSALVQLYAALLASKWRLCIEHITFFTTRFAFSASLLLSVCFAVKIYFSLQAQVCNETSLFCRCHASSMRRAEPLLALNASQRARKSHHTVTPDKKASIPSVS